MRYVPNALTIARILLTPLVLVLILTPTFWAQLAGLVLFVLASASDWLDGKLARLMKARSRLGMFLDPLADKILVLGTFAVLALMFPHAVPWWGVLLIALRDITITGLRIWSEAQGRPLQTLPWAKAKTLAQLVFLIGTLLVLVLSHLPGVLGGWSRWMLEDGTVLLVLMLLVVGLTVGTGALYFTRKDVYTAGRNPASRNS